MYSLIRPFVFSFPPEKAHGLAMQALECRLSLAGLPPPPLAAARTVMGLSFNNPVGLAAGFDKSAEHVDAIATLGFGFIEVGGVTPKPQAGNPAPRLFRLPQAGALINRMGFNNAGAAAVARNLKKRRYSGIVGINIGKNADTSDEETIGDYLECLKILYEYGDFFVLNISSPNTKNLRAWQQQDALLRLLNGVTEQRARLAEQYKKQVPLAVKIAPDMEDDNIRSIAQIIQNVGIEGVVAVNTTIERPPAVAGFAAARESGGLSGQPLKARATAVIRCLRAALPADVAIIGVGGIAGAADAEEKLDAGADLVQLYTGLIYQGAGLPRKIINALS